MANEDTRVLSDDKLPELGEDLLLASSDYGIEIDNSELQDVSDSDMEDLLNSLGDDLVQGAVEESVETASGDDEDIFSLFDTAVEDSAIVEAVEYNVGEQDDVNDLYVSTGYSEEFLDEETRNFIADLTTTLEIRSNPAGNIPEPKGHNIVSRSKSKEYAEIIQIMKGLLGAVQKYNDTLDKNMLPVRMRDKVIANRIIAYNDADNIVWNEFYTLAMSNMNGDVAKLNKLKQSISDIRKIFVAYCDNYEKADEYNRAIRERRERNTRIASKEFAFYMEVIRRLESGSEKVALCNSLTFRQGDNTKYSFQCGRCKELADGANTILSSMDGSEIRESDTHTFYQVLLNGPRSLFYPMVCEHCGAINTVSTSSRRLMREGILREPTKSSRDTRDYLSSNISESGNHSIGNRATISKGKWMDLLESKLVTEEVPDYSDSDLTQDEILDREFYIIEDDGVATKEDLIAEVDMEAYKNAIKSFRQRNDIINCKNDIESSGKDGVESALALLAANGNSTFLNNVFEFIAGYVVTTKTFQELAETRENLNIEYSRYLAIHGALNLCNMGEDVTPDVIKEFENEYKVKYDIGELTLADMDAQKEYQSYKTHYDKLCSEMLNNVKLFGYKSKDKRVSAIEDIAEAFNRSDVFVEFMTKALRETIINASMSSLQSSFGLRINGKKITADPVRGLSPIKDRDHIQGNKYKTVKEYANRIVKGGPKLNIDIKKLIDAFHADYTLYLKLKEWEEMFGFNKDVRIDDIVNSGDALSHYYRTLGDILGDISGYEKIRDMSPKFIERDYFKIIFGDISGTLLMDAIRNFNNILELPKFGAYDIVFSRLLLTQVEFHDFIGMSGMDIASNLKLTNSIVLKFYDKGLDTIQREVSEEERYKMGARRCLNHTFLHYRNDSGELSILSKYLCADELDDPMAIVRGVIAQMEYIKAEAGDIEDLSENLPIVDM